MTQPHFADDVMEKVRALGHPLCVGLDPHLSKLPPVFRRGDMAPFAPETSRAVRDFCCALLDRVAGRVPVVKPQIALFEQLGPAGLSALAEVVAHARGLGLPVLMDAKRGDIGSTADGYAAAFLSPGAPLESDALTVNPYMGMDTLTPYIQAMKEHGRGLFVLVKTSNPGSSAVQDLALDDGPVFVHVARLLATTAQALRGPRTGWSSLGVVVGATYPEQGQQVREALPHALFLVPGYGAQGGSAADAVSTFVRGPSGLEGGLVNSSRGVLFPDQAAAADSAAAWEKAIDAALDRAITELGEAVS